MTDHEETLVEEQDETTQEGAEEAAEEVDYEALEAKVSENLSAAFGDEDDSEQDDTEVDEEPEEGAEESEEESDEEDAEESEESDEGEESEEEAAAEPADPDAPTLPEAHRRSLKAYGWNDDEINQNLKALGSSFIQTAEKIHSNRNAELSQWAAAGRQKREQEGGEQGTTDGQQSTQQAQQGLPGELKPVDAAKLKEQYGDDDLIDAIVGPVNAAIQSINSTLPQLQQGTQQAQQANTQAVTQQVDEFFGDESVKPYKSLYGDNTEEVTEEQLTNRNKVLDTAYDLMVGANVVHGRQMNVKEALQHAHEIVSKDFKTNAVRDGLKKQAKQRNKGIVNKPSSRKGGESRGKPGKPRTRRELENKVASKLGEAFS